MDGAHPREVEPISAGTPVLPSPFAVDSTGNVFGNLFYGSGANLTGVNALFLRGKSPGSFAGGTHTHPGLDPSTATVIPAFVRTGTEAAVLTYPNLTNTCTGTVGATSTCEVFCPGTAIPGGFTLLVSGGCKSTGGTCAASGRAVTESIPDGSTSFPFSWNCSTACNDGLGGTTNSEGHVVCVVSY